MLKFLNKGISTPIVITIIIVLAIVLVGGVLAYQYYYFPKQETEMSKVETPKTETPENEIKNNQITEHETYNHAGEIVKIYQKDEKEYLDINFIKFLLFVDEKGHPVDTPNYIYGENDEEGSCSPVADPYCVVDNDKTIESFGVAKNVEIIPASYPGTPISFNELEEIIKYSSIFFRLQIEDNTIQKMQQIYIP
ncbi:hypothetical protein KKG51_04985 [Patescibacteria group bacterium]|nr:hypothetical protein [Patescibacteria group bacterium]MBU2578194.1 hypothetical protein [Patescibacteria group bacterium]